MSERTVALVVTSEAFSEALDTAMRIFEPAYDDLSPSRRLYLNVDMQAALLAALRDLGIEVQE